MSSNPVWRSSSLCDMNGSCVLFADLGSGVVGIRDGKAHDGPVLRFDRAEVAEFAAAYVAGEFEVPPL